MKRSARFMTLGIGLILAGMLGFLLMHLEPSPSGSVLIWYIGEGLPLLGVLAGPVLLLIGFFIKDKDDKK